MLALEELSRIGIGTYRMTINNRNHLNALEHAFKNGCNFIDTASNYTNGGSEELIGHFLSEKLNSEVFVVTKAGYIQGKNIQVFEELNEKGLAKEEVVNIGETSSHSIHPDFLNDQLNRSLKRLNRDYVDGFLLHNTEYYLTKTGAGRSKEIYYQRIKKAFEFLEEQVQKGLIRYYGVSSNNLPLSDDEATATSLMQLIDTAEKVHSENHFKLIQFPYNIIENGAEVEYDSNESVLALAKRKGIITIGNRPLNVHKGKEFIRLATYDEISQKLNFETDKLSFENCYNLMQDRVRSLGSDDDISELEVMKFLDSNWMKIGNHSAVEQLINQHFAPLVDYLFDGEIFNSNSNKYQKEREVFSSFINMMRDYSTKTMSEKAVLLKEELLEKNIIDPSDSRPLSVIMCEKYFNSGVNHIMVGMRKKEYIDQMKELF